MQERLRIGTRGSPLALAQAHLVRAQVLAANPDLSPDNGDVEIVVISTRGDEITDRPLAEIGGKGLFTKEIEDQLRDQRIDLAVHSSKDMPTVLPEGLVLSIFPAREDPRDAFIAPHAENLAGLKEGAIVGTASLRRGAQILRARPDLRIVNFRGNVQTRIKKLEAGEVDATLLAMAGLNRLQMAHVASSVMDTDIMLPAPAQGAIGIELREGDADTHKRLLPLNHQPTALAVTAERALLRKLDGSCRTPIAALAKLNGERMELKARVLSLDGTRMFEASGEGPLNEPEDLGIIVGNQLLSAAGPAFFEALKADMKTNMEKGG
jgi:hydroxymethylbilane synthase